MLSRFPHRGAPRQQQRGLSIVELMVGVTIGLIIAAAAALLMTGQLVENRRLLAETQVQQDLRASTDLMSRELRRAGANSEINVLNTVWYPGSTGTQPNGMTGSLTPTPSRVDFNYHPGTGAAAGPFAFRLQSNVVETLIGGSMQQLTDRNAMKTNALTSALNTDSSATLTLPCPKACLPPGGPTDCWPRYEVRRAQIAIQAEAKADDKVQRSLRTTVRVRNDRVLFASEIVPPGIVPPPVYICPL